VPNEMNILFSKINKLLKIKMNIVEALFWSSWIHLEIALVHPFLDGNGRVARLIEKWFLAQKLGKKEVWLLQSEKYYFSNRARYYKALQLGDNYWQADISKAKAFLEFLLGFVKKQS
jgi:Fic family protein